MGVTGTQRRVTVKAGAVLLILFGLALVAIGLGLHKKLYAAWLYLMGELDGPQYKDDPPHPSRTPVNVDESRKQWEKDWGTRAANRRPGDAFRIPRAIRWNPSISPAGV